MENMKNGEIFKFLPKREQFKIEKEIIKYERSLEGIKKMSNIPDIMFIIDPHEEITAVSEARKLNIPIVAICDTNCNPDLIDYPIPGNDDAIRAVKLFCSIIADAVLEGKCLIEKHDNDENFIDESKKTEKEYSKEN
jgi:small subunit ribosomal protein S2